MVAIRLLQPVGLQETEEIQGSSAEALFTNSPPQSHEVITPAQSVAVECSDKETAVTRGPVSFGNGVMRPFRNRTHFFVTIAIGRDTLARLGPCFTSMVITPPGEFTITARASVLQGGGQQEIPLDIVVNPDRTGWDVINRERTEAKTIATRVLPH